MSSPSAPQIELDLGSGASSGWLEGWGLHRPEFLAWALYDWANSAVATTIIAAVLPIYFYEVVGKGLPPGAAPPTTRLCECRDDAGARH